MTEQVREAIIRSGQSLNHLAQESGVSASQLSRFVRGERDITLQAADKICRTLRLRLTGGSRRGESKN